MAQMLVRNIQETGWFLDNGRLGAPGPWTCATSRWPTCSISESSRRGRRVPRPGRRFQRLRLAAVPADRPVRLFHPAPPPARPPRRSRPERALRLPAVSFPAHASPPVPRGLRPASADALGDPPRLHGAESRCRGWTRPAGRRAGGCGAGKPPGRPCCASLPGWPALTTPSFPASSCWWRRPGRRAGAAVARSGPPPSLSCSSGGRSRSPWRRRGSRVALYGQTAKSRPACPPRRTPSD